MNKDRLRILTLGLDGTKALFWNASVSGGLLLTQGLDALGARDQADATTTGIPLSRLGSRPDYSNIDLHARYDQALPMGLSASAILRGQQSFTGAMPSAAQFSLDGVDGLSAFPLGTLNVDSGMTARGELAHPFTIGEGTFASVISPYVFAAGGFGSLADPTAAERAHVDADAYGVGLRFNLAEQSTGVTSLASIELGRAHANIIASDDTRVTVSWTVKY